MDIDKGTAISASVGPSQTPEAIQVTSLTPSNPSSTLINASASARLAGRTLRARPSQPQLATHSSSKSSGPSSTHRSPSDKDLEHNKKYLGPEGVQSRREAIVREKEQKLRSLVDEHDTAVREKFHLERFISLLEGWDPKEAKHTSSPVFQQYKDSKHNLLDLVPSHASGTAGPSRSRAPSRTTRRQAHEQTELFSTLPTANPTPHGHTVITNGRAPSSKGKGKVDDVSTPTSIKGKGKARTSLGGEMPPPPVPVPKHQRKGNRRLTINVAPAEHLEMDTGDKGKKRGRISLPNLPLSKKQKGAKIVIDEPVEVSSPVVDSPAQPAPEPLETSPTPAPLPSLAHLPFPAPPFRPPERITGPRFVWYTDPTQLPPDNHTCNGNLTEYLSSYIHIEDTGNQPDLKALELRAAREAYLRNRVNYLQQQGRLLRLLDDSDTSGPIISKSHGKVIKAPPRKTDRQDSLMAHMVQVRDAMLNEAKSKPVTCKRVARIIQSYWEHEEGKEERERAAEEKEMKRKARDLMRALRKRWGLAVKIIRAKVLEAQKLEQDRLGKEHLQNMLQRSTGLLEAQRDDIVGREDEDEEQEEMENEEDDETDREVDDSEGTPDVSSAEDSEVQSRGALEGRLGGSEDRLEEVDNFRVVEEGDLRDEEDGSDDEDDGRTESEGGEDDSNGDVDLRALIAYEADVGKGLENGHPNGGVQDVGMMLASTENRAAVIDQDRDAERLPVTASLSSNELVTNPTASPSNGPVQIEIKDSFKLATDGDSVIPQTNGIMDTPTTLPNRPRRARKSFSVSSLVKTEDPDATDPQFDDGPDDVSEQDYELDVAMEDEEDAESDSEDAGLLADADVPIEELLKRYGYSVPSTEVKDAEVETMDVDPIITDKSLLDGSLMVRSPSGLIVEGKRNRRIRSVWTPEDNPPPPPPVPRRPKVAEVESEVEMTPELSNEEEDEDEEDEAELAEPEDPNRVRPPFLLRGTLRPYQQGGLEWLASLYANKMNGILADEMGLGKTIQTIALLGHLACDKGVWGHHLIIVPTSVILNWEMEFKKFLPAMKVLTYYGNQKERKEKRIGWHTENAWQVCITSYQIVLADQHIFRRKNWVYMILDEAHNIKNFRSQRWQTLLGFKAQRRLLLTGTPLQNNLMELWSLLYFLMPNGVTADATAVVGFANHKEFMEWFSNPMDKAIETGDSLDAETLETVAKLHTLLRPFILRRLKSEVETQLPGKFEHVVYCRLSKRQRFLYDEFMSRASTREALTSGGYLGVVNTLMQLRKVCNHPDLFEVRPVRTSFAMERSVAADFEPSELLVRKRLLQKTDELDLKAYNLLVSNREEESAWACQARRKLDASDLLPHAIEVHRKGRLPEPPKVDNRTVEGWLKYRAHVDERASITRWRSLRDYNRLRCAGSPIYGSTFISMLTDLSNRFLPDSVSTRTKSDLMDQHVPPVAPLILSLSDRIRLISPIIDRYAVMPPNAVARDLPQLALPGLEPRSHPSLLDTSFDTLHDATVKLQIAFPDASLLQYDCGKLQKLYEMLRELKSEGHRVLIFTQMTRVLDILEMFLSYNGHRYLRLDGSTKIEDRQIITERFNTDTRIFCFIASSRSGGVGINLTGADTVFFYDSDWNPSMDRQCMDRAHRIGQTREVHIYRFVSTHTVEENMLKKANQKRLLDRVVIQEGEFTTDFFGKMDWRDVIETNGGAVDKVDDEERVVDVDVEGTPVAMDAEKTEPRAGEEREFADALAEVEDEEDAAAARVAQGEGEMDIAEFGDGQGKKSTDQPACTTAGKVFETESSGTPVVQESATPRMDGVDEEEEEDEVGAVDEYMLRWVEWDWDWFSNW